MNASIDQLIQQLAQQIGQLQVELTWTRLQLQALQAQTQSTESPKNENQQNN